MLHNELLQRKVALLGVSSEVLGNLADVASSQISRYLNGQRQLKNEELLRIDQIVSEMEALAAIADPWALPLKNPAKMRILIAKYREGEFAARTGENQ